MLIKGEGGPICRSQKKLILTQSLNTVARLLRTHVACKRNRNPAMCLKKEIRYTVRVGERLRGLVLPHRF